MHRFIFWAWITAAIALLLYSFTQVDLSLTLSRVSIWQGIQKSFQYVGYFDRPLSTLLYIGIIIVMFGLYLKVLDMVRNNKLTRKRLWQIIISVSAILFFSYNAFSYDIFNYIFDAKIVTFYNENPYERKALDYPQDPMLSFMHWTHRTYPYGPVWLLLTVPLSFLGLGYFLVTFYLFKLLMVASFIGSAFFVEKISKKLKINPLLALSVFALNPLVIIESLVSAHNDIVMMFLALVSLFYFFEKKVIHSIIFLVASIGVKFATVFMLPALLLDLIFKVNKETVIRAIVVSMIAALFIVIARTNFQPWYLLLVLPFASLISNRFYVIIPIVVISFFALLQYVPYLYLGNWNPPVPTILNYIMIASIALSAVLILIWKFKVKN
jgi:hypothetical protein